jgi:hypothetical protein
VIALCFGLAGAVALTLPVPESGFTLAWNHSVEKIRWEEHYRVRADGLHLDQARVRGTGAGMEIPDGARLVNGFWTYRPHLPTLQPLRLTRSTYTSGYEICIRGRCRLMSALLGPPAKKGSSALELWSCEATGKSGRRFQGSSMTQR